MKRCPECEFIYEDDQGVCDMDGSKLALDPRPLPKLQALYDESPAFGEKRIWKGHRVPVFASLILTAALFLVYYISTHHSGRQSIAASATASESAQPTAQIAPLTNPVPAATVEEKTEDYTPIDGAVESGGVAQGDNGIVGSGRTGQHHVPAESAVSTPLRKERPKPATSAAREVERGTPAPPRKPPSPNEQHSEKPDKDSKIGSILKKTGRLLKKPFRL